MDENGNVPDLHEALDRTRSDTRRAVNPDDIPPPPRDWMSHPVARVIWGLILLAIIAALIWKGPAWIAYFKEHPTGGVFTVVIILAIIGLIAFAFWRHRTQGSLGERYWDTERREKKE